MLTYFLQVNVCWLLFYGAYFALLSRETFFRLNRIWLIVSLLGGLILPLIAPAFEVVEPTNMAAVMLEPFVISASNFSQNVQNTEGSFLRILAAIYGLGVAVSLGKLVMGFWKIKRLAHRAERLPIEDFTLMQVQETIAPFSFFRWVFINLNLIQSADLQQIILHEQAHVRERHSFDVVFAEVLGVVFWWSPLVYFYTKSLKNVHEYAADAAVLRTSTPPQYGRLLLRQQQSGMSLSLANPFFSQLKKRILMMTRNKSKRRALAKYALALPIFLILTVLLASPKTKVMATTEVLSNNVVSTIETFEKTHFDGNFDGNSAQETGQKDIIVQLETGQKSGIISPDALKSLQDDKPSVAPEDGILVILEDANGNALTLPSKTLRTKDLPTNFDRLKVVQVVDGIQKILDVEEFVFFRIPRNQDPVRIRNMGNKFSDELKELFATLELTDMCQIANIRTVGNGPKINARTFVLEYTPQYPPLLGQKQGELRANTVKKDSVEPALTVVDNVPTFIGGNDSMFRFLGRNIQYPQDARDRKIEGTVYIGFVVEKDGALSSFKLLRNVPPQVDTIMHYDPATKKETQKIVTSEVTSLSDEAMRVMKLMPKWKAGKQQGKIVRVAFTLPIKFKLD